MRRVDSGWRDPLIQVRHRYYGYEAPAAGMKLPMIEYDHGEPLAVISYLERSTVPPYGGDVMRAHLALGRLHRATGEQLPFFTAQYDHRNWAFRLFGHNEAARAFLDRTGWVSMTEAGFVNSLYRLRGRYVPNLSSFGVEFNETEWIGTHQAPDYGPTETWTGQAMSRRRRNYEPVAQTRASWRNPCLDIDFAVVDRDQNVAMVVDYKSPSAKVNLASTNMKALSGLFGGSHAGFNVPAFVACYRPTKPAWTYSVHPLNASARSFLAYALGTQGGPPTPLAQAVASDWVDLSERQWKSVLDCARDT